MSDSHISDKKNILNKVAEMRLGKQCMMNDYEMDILAEMDIEVEYVSIPCFMGYLVMSKDHPTAKVFRKKHLGIE